MALLSHDIISVSYSDYGELGLVSNSSLRYLEPRFMQIPTLAIKAKLHGKNLYLLHMYLVIHKCTLEFP